MIETLAYRVSISSILDAGVAFVLCGRSITAEVTIYNHKTNFDYAMFIGHAECYEKSQYDLPTGMHIALTKALKKSGMPIESSAVVENMLASYFEWMNVCQNWQTYVSSKEWNHKKAALLGVEVVDFEGDWYPGCQEG